jgi:CheY-like chemotaxis protein
VADAEYINQLEPKALSELGKVSPIISCPMPSGRRMMQKFGVTDYLVKPVSAVALGQAIEQMRLTVRSILIVDDDPEIVRLFDRMLRSMNKGYVIRKAYSGLEGLALMRSSPPDLVILDLLMPNVDGLAVIQHMKHTEALANIPVVMVSARGASEAITPVSNGRLSVYKAEGFQPMELIRCVESLVDSLSVASSPKSSVVPADRAAF